MRSKNRRLNRSLGAIDGAHGVRVTLPTTTPEYRCEDSLVHGFMVWLLANEAGEAEIVSFNHVQISRSPIKVIMYRSGEMQIHLQTRHSVFLDLA